MRYEAWHVKATGVYKQLRFAWPHVPSSSVMKSSSSARWHSEAGVVSSECLAHHGFLLLLSGEWNYRVNKRWQKVNEHYGKFNKQRSPPVISPFLAASSIHHVPKWGNGMTLFISPSTVWPPHQYHAHWSGGDTAGSGQLNFSGGLTCLTEVNNIKQN